MGIPQIIMVILFSIGLGIEIKEHGKPKEGKHNFITFLIATMLNIALLYWGGFFKK